MVPQGMEAGTGRDARHLHRRTPHTLTETAREQRISAATSSRRFASISRSTTGFSSFSPAAVIMHSTPAR